MKTDLDLLIKQYEKERSALEKTIADYTNERDYLYAYYQQKALWKVNGTLNHLYKMKVPFYEDILQLENLKRLYNKKQQNNKQGNLAGFWSNKTEEQEAKLKELNKQEAKPFYDGQVIDDALFDLVEGKLKGFNICFREEQKICIEFKLNDKFIEIALPAVNLNEFDPEDDENYQHIGIFTALGFHPDDNNQLVYKYPIKSFKDAVEIKILLARLMYDIFWYNEKYDAAKLICY